MVKCGRGCQLPLHSTVERMHGEPCDTECNAYNLCLMASVTVGAGGGQVGGTGGGGPFMNKWKGQAKGRGSGVGDRRGEEGTGEW